MKLRDYQIDAISAIKDTFEESNRQYVVLPTGSGKTITFLSYLKDNHNNALIVVPSKELLNQVYESALLFFDKKDISRKGNNFDETIGSIHICIVNSMRGSYLKRLEESYFEIVVIDEAHHSQSKSYRRMIYQRTELYPDTKFLGFTATPDRMDGLFLADILDILSFQKELYDMIRDGYLSDIEGYSVKTKINLADVDDHNGDFSIRQLYKKLCVKSRNELIINLCKRDMKDRKCLIFCINRDHSKVICKMLNDEGLSAKHIDGKSSISERHSILGAFQRGEVNFLTNCQLLTEGFDEPSIDGIILARPTRSKALFLQMLGRGLRLSPGKKNCKVIDIMDNHKLLANFNHIYLNDYEYLDPLDQFSSAQEIAEYCIHEMIRIEDSKTLKTNFFGFTDLKIDEIVATYSMYKYLEDNDIQFFKPLTFKEASFLIWLHKLKEQYYGTHKKI